MIEYTGAIHIHSKFSDGSGDPDFIATMADEVGLDYLILTDHNTLRALKDGFEGWYGSSLLLVGCEINDKENKNHYLAFGIEDTISTRISAGEYVKKVNNAGGIGFLAHPHEKREHMKEHPAYPWTAWDCNDFTGIEIWNHMSEWMENLTEENKYQAFIHPLKSIIAPPAETLKKWDELSLQRKIVGIGGVDAHAHKHNILGFMEVEVFPYKVLFKSIRTHVLTTKSLIKEKTAEALKKNKEIIYGALKNGSCFVANDYHYDSKGFRFFALCGDKKYNMGDEVLIENKVKLQVLLPAKSGNIMLFYNGKKIDSIEHNEAEFIVDKPGVYRVEVYYNGHAWIYSNHIRLMRP